MQLKTLLSLFPLVAAVAGYVLPEGTPDGFYAIAFDDEGNSNLTRLPDALVARGVDSAPLVEGPGLPMPAKRSPDSSSAKFAKRDSWGNTGRWFPNANDYNACTDGWKNYFNTGGSVPPRQIYVLQYGQAVLAVCNYLWAFSITNSAGRVDGTNLHLDQTYGYWSTGWVHWDVNDVTFWRDLAGTHFCSNLP